MTMLQNFETYLQQENMSKNTINAYLFAVRDYFAHYKDLSKKNLLLYKTQLIENRKPKTVNLRLQALNRYLEFVGKSKWRLKSVKVQQRSYLENVISNADYKFLKASLLKDGYKDWYFVVWFMTATGARVSELLQIKAEHVELGHLDI